MPVFRFKVAAQFMQLFNLRTKIIISELQVVLLHFLVTDLLSPQDQKPGDQGQKDLSEILSGDLSMASKRTKTRCREHIKMKMNC